jgi:hypothetical protein
LKNGPLKKKKKKEEWTDSDYNETIIETFYVPVEKWHEAAHGGCGVDLWRR